MLTDHTRQVMLVFQVQVNGGVVEGEGTLLVNLQLEQDAAYWEVVVVRPGTISAGLSKHDPSQIESTIGEGTQSFGSTWTAQELKEGDVIGICFQQSDFPMLSFTLNGLVDDGRSVKRFRGDTFPAVTVKDSAQIRFEFDNFKYQPPTSRFVAVMVAKNML
eukprot:c2670_g1_i2.p1 GENE.c2670_g1_i2~~c2670_g1_i2.p1  ORF type:complete len:161 (-),score=39.45 c2670_g1_i2:110-592(-)